MKKIFFATAILLSSLIKAQFNSPVVKIDCTKEEIAKSNPTLKFEYKYEYNEIWSFTANTQNYSVVYYFKENELRNYSCLIITSNTKLALDLIEYYNEKSLVIEKGEKWLMKSMDLKNVKINLSNTVGSYLFSYMYES